MIEAVEVEEANWNEAALPNRRQLRPRHVHTIRGRLAADKYKTKNKTKYRQIESENR